MMTSEKNIANTHKHIRKRKKHLYKELRHQMEFYFSDANLQKDRFLNKQLMDSLDGYINLDTFLRFNKIRSLTDNIHDLASSIKESSYLQIDNEKKKIRRVTPFVESTNVDERTVYIEPLPSNTTIELIQTHFSNCGKVVYISLPRYKSTRDIKGFAFVEFETIEAAQLACQTLNISTIEKVGIFPKCSKNCMELEKQLKKTQELKSIEETSNLTSQLKIPIEFKNKNNANITEKNTLGITDDRDKNLTENKSEKEDHNSKDLKLSTLTEISNDTNKIKSKSRKRKISLNSEKDIPIKIESAKNYLKIPKDQQKDDENMDEVIKNKKKKIKTKKKQIYSADLLKEQDIDNSVKKPIKAKLKNKGKLFQDLKVIPKSEWLKLKSIYILKQKNNMKLLKNKLNQLKKESNIDVPSACIQSNRLNINKNIIDASQDTKPDEITCSKIKDFTYIPGVVLKFESKHEHSRKDIKSLLDVKYKIGYVDFSDGDKFGFVRCLDAETASILSNDCKCDGLTFQLLNAEDELKYWDKINFDRQAKYMSRVKKVKKGKEKLKNRADKYLQSLTSTHIVFDEN